MQYPDGIGHDNAETPRRHASPLPLALLALFLSSGLTGSLGGQSDTRLRAESPQASLAVSAPEILRNGEFFEIVIDVAPKESVQDLVIGISDELWKKMTINTLLPAAEQEDFSDGLHRFSFGKMPRGQVLSIKIDGQVNPHLGGRSSGEFSAFDGEQKLVQLTFSTTVLP